jgi:hypothetical protein
MEPQNTAISSTQIGIGADMWATVHILRNAADPEYDPMFPPELTAEEVEEILGIDARAQNKIIERFRKRLTQNMIR